MFRLWGRMIKDNHLVKDLVVTREDDTRTHRVFGAVDEICMAWNLERPIWLDKNVEEFKKQAKTRFYADSFIEHPEFDYIEIRILEE